MVADRIFSGGDILTVAGDEPEYIDAIAVINGEIVFSGTKAEVLAYMSDDTEMVDLNGQTMLPGFIDDHSHFVQTAIKLSTVNLDLPPAGDTSSIADLQAALSAELEINPRGPDEFLWGWGYDTGSLAEKSHPTRDELDAVSTEVPVALYHFSSHVMAVNSRALEIAGIDENFEAPEGGVYRKDENRRLTGVLEETAMAPYLFRLLSSMQGEALFNLLEGSAGIRRRRLHRCG